MDHTELNDLLSFIIKFAKTNNEILAIGLCGSWARGTPGPDSDIDLSIITADKEIFKSPTWLEEIDFDIIRDKLLRFEDRKYGRVWSRHVFLESGTEIEFSFADKSWADIDPIDAGTQKVVSDGYRIIYDPHQILSRLVHKLNTNP